MRKSIIAVMISTALLPGYAEQKPESTQEPTVITSKTLTFDYQRSIAVFQDDVVVVDPQIRMESDKLNVVFDQTNDVKSVTASGAVQLWHADKRASCDRAIYIARTGEVILQGDARVMREGDVVAGNEIVFWLNEDRMICKPGHVIFYPGKRELPQPESIPKNSEG